MTIFVVVSFGIIIYKILICISILKKYAHSKHLIIHRLIKFYCHVYLMPTRSGRKLKERITISCDPINVDRINKSLESKEFSSVSSLVNNAISFYFENRRKDQKEAFKQFLSSDEGEEIIMKIFQKIDDKKKK